MPPEAFDEAFAKREAGGDYHAQILSFLFHERLNKSDSTRISHSNTEIERALGGTRFLNGSLFARHQYDDVLRMSDADYFGTEPQSLGLLTILADYDWTASEHTPYSSDQTIDPEVLSNLFENLIAVTQYGKDVPERMPEGTYYTPADLALEMVKDALTEAVKEAAPHQWTKADLRELFGDEDAAMPEATPGEQERLAARIRNLTIYDPAVGSGEFPFTACNSIRSALQKLGVADKNAALIREIISRQLFAQDINPMAVQVTRLRLFVAIIAHEDADQVSQPPLPNLEGRIICADTLATHANEAWRPHRRSTLDSTNLEVQELLTRRARIISRWLDAHTEGAKAKVRADDEQARNELRSAVAGKRFLEEVAKFAEAELLNPDAAPAQADPRLMFYDENWQGFDIAIGNPPYESYGKRDRGRTKDQLILQGYTTTKGNDLYNLLAEAALALVRPDGGVVTLVVPLSLSFGQDKENTRKLFENRSSNIWLRHQDNRPDKTFHDSPVAHPENAQRTTIVTATTGQSNPTIQTTGTSKWRKSEREQYLLSRRHAKAIGNKRHTKLQSQWPRIPSTEIAYLLEAMNRQKSTVATLAPQGAVAKLQVGIPMTARYFITTTPSGTMKRTEQILPIRDMQSLELAIAALNGHVAYGWWSIYGDAFHIKPYEMTTVAIPDRWQEDKAVNREARRLGKLLIEAVAEENIKVITTGTKSSPLESMSFHDFVPETIAEIDALYLDALALPKQPILKQLHTMRSDSNWSLGTAF